MENASKALIFAASVLIAIMIFSIMFYMFKKFGTTASNTEALLSEKEVKEFNGELSGYGTIDNVNLTRYTPNGEISQIKNFKYAKIFSLAFLSPLSSSYADNQKFYKQALVTASQNLNTVFDVVTAVNFAINNNIKTNDDYRYNSLEVVNSLEIIVDLTERLRDDFTFNTNSHYRYLVIEPGKKVTANTVYGMTTSELVTNDPNNYKNKEKNVDKFNILTTTPGDYSSRSINLYNVISELNQSKVISYQDKDYTVYKYYFFGECFTNEITGKIETVKFSLIQDENF